MNTSDCLLSYKITSLITAIIQLVNLLAQSFNMTIMFIHTPNILTAMTTDIKGGIHHSTLCGLDINTGF